jgi:hypothetical protein
MRNSRATIQFPAFLFAIVPVAILTFAAIATIFAQAPTPAGWTTHNDAKGFAMDTPPGWNFSSDAQAGRIVVQGPQGQRVVVWPASIGQTLDARGAAALVQQMARQVDAQMPWGAAAATASAVRTIAKGPQRSGAAMMTWANSAAGTSVLFYCVEAPSNAYRAETDTFATILRSFHVVQAPATTAAPAAAGKPAGPITFTTWSDPRENAFSLSVPQGWNAVGGAYRLSATDIRSGVALASPDGQIRVRLGDSNLGTFIEPNQMMAYAGLREGMYYGLGDGSRLLIRRYLNGQQAALLYAQTFVSKECSGLQIASNSARPDVAQTYGPQARSEGMPGAQLTAGDVTFTCTMGGTAVHGKFITATLLPLPGQSGLWYIYRLYGYLAAPGHEQDAERVAEQGVNSFRINPQWQAQQQQIAGAAVAADNARSQQIRQQAMQAIQKDQQETSDIIMKGWEQRNQVYDEISRRRENAILGTLDVVDPETGASYKIDNYSDYHWMNNSGTIAGNNTGTTPGPDWHELVTLP